MIWAPVLIGLTAFVALAVSGADAEFAAAAVTLMVGLTATVVLGFPHTREAALNALWRHRFGAGTLVALILYSLVTVGGLTGAPISITPHLTGAAAWTLASLGLAALAAAGAAEAAGRDRVLQGLLWTPMALALAILVDLLDGGADFFGLLGVRPIQGELSGPFRTQFELGAAFALFVLISAFSAIDEIRRRPAPGAFNFPPLSRRLLLPGGAALISLMVLIIAGAYAALAGAILGVLTMWAIMTSRFGGAERGGVGAPAVTMPAYAAGAAAVIVLVLLAIPSTFSAIFAADGTRLPYMYLGEMVDKASLDRPWTGYGFGAFPTVAADRIAVDSTLSGFATPSGDLAVWRVEAGFVGILLGVAAVIAYLAPLGLAKDRGRRPGRGLALGVGVAAVCLVAGVPHAVLSTPGIAHLAALMLGLASTFVDDARPRRKPAPRSFAEVLERSGAAGERSQSRRL